MLNKVLPFVTFGYPTLKTIKDLIYKRGHGKVNGARIALQDNRIIEKALEKHHITCIEDLIHEVHGCGPAFKQANNFLWPFKLNPPRGGYSAKRHPFHNEGDWGNREQFINDFVQRMI